MELHIDKFQYYTSTRLLNLFISQYTSVFGEPELEKTINIISNSTAINHLIYNSLKASEFPSAEQILSVVLTINKFELLFNNPESICLASLITIKELEMAFSRSPSTPKGEIINSYYGENISLCVDVMTHCYKFDLENNNFIKIFCDYIDSLPLPKDRTYTIYDDPGDDDSPWGEYDGEINRGK